MADHSPPLPSFPAAPHPQAALLCGFDFAIAPLVRSDYRPPPASAAGLAPGQLVQPFQREDVLYLPSSARVSQVGVHGCMCIRHASLM